MLKKFFIFFLIIIPGYPAFSQWAIMKSDADTLVRLGADYIYNVKFDSAEACFRAVIHQYPKDPAGYFLIAMIDWWKISFDNYSKRYEKPFLNKIQKVIEVCDNILDTNAYDINALFFKGGALGYRGRYYAQNKDWLPAAEDGAAAYNILLKCQKLASGNHDIMLGTGIYNYFAEVIPVSYPIVRPIINFLPKGDKSIGILQLKAASNNARYAKVEAKVVLLQIYYSFEHNYAEALSVADELFKKYPDNPFFHKYIGRCLATMGDRVAMETVWREILNRFISKKFGYDNSVAREALYYIGSCLMDKGNYEMAMKYLYKCDEVSRILDTDGPSGFMVMTNLKIGKIFDKQGKRKYAIMQYEKLLKMKDYNGSQNEANVYLKTPYR